MAGEKRFTRIPPESTGDRLYMVHTAEIEFVQKLDAQGGDTDHVWNIGKRYDIVGFLGGDVHVHGVYDKGDGTGILAVHYNASAKFENAVPEALAVISYNGTPICKVGVAYDVYVPTTHLMGYDNPEYGLEIDRFGAANIRFSEGQPELAAYGQLRIANSKVLARYNFDVSAMPDQFANSLLGSGTAVWDPGKKWIRLGLEGNLGNGASGDLATNTSHLYHPLSYGSGVFVIMGTVVPDTGKATCVRNWGPFDATDGFMFRLTGSGLSVVHRRTFDGVQSETVIPQANWNGDRLDGAGGNSNRSGVTLDVTTANQYFYDYQVLAGGSIRWGIIINGERIICHEMDMSNRTDIGWQTNAIGLSARPVCWATKRLSAPTEDTADYFYALGAGVWTDAQTDPVQELGKPGSLDETFVLDNKLTTAGVPYTQGAYYLTSMRPISVYPAGSPAAGQFSHSLYAPETIRLNCFNQDGTFPDGELRVFLKCILRGEKWENPSYSTIERDGDAATSVDGIRAVYNAKAHHIGHGPEILRVPIRNGVSEVDLERLFDNIQYGAVRPNTEVGLSRRKQPLTNITGNVDRYNRGIPRVEIEVGPDPERGGNIHYFEEKDRIVFKDIVDAGTDGPATLLNKAFYMSFLSSNDAWLYDSDAGGLSLLEDDRNTRIINFTPSTVPLGINNISPSNQDSAQVAGAGTALVLDYDSDNGQIYLEGRNNALLDTGLAGGTAFTVKNSTGSTLLSTTLTSINTVGVNNYPLDYKTSLNAVSSSGWATPAFDLVNEGNVEGEPPPAPVWTFMYNPIGGDDLGFQPGGSQPSAPDRTYITFNVVWKELNQ